MPQRTLVIASFDIFIFSSSLILFPRRPNNYLLRIVKPSKAIQERACFGNIPEKPSTTASNGTTSICL